MLLGHGRIHPQTVQPSLSLRKGNKTDQHSEKSSSVTSDFSKARCSGISIPPVGSKLLSSRSEAVDIVDEHLFEMVVQRDVIFRVMEGANQGLSVEYPTIAPTVDALSA